MTNTKEKIKLYVYMFSTTFLLILRDVFSLSINKLIFVAIALMLMLISKFETVVHMICFTFPLICGLPGNYILLVAIAILLLKSYNCLNCKQIILILSVAFLELFSSIWYTQIPWLDMIAYICALGIMFFLLFDSRRINYKSICTIFFWSLSLLCMLIFINTIKSAPQNWMTQYANGYFRFGDEHYDEHNGMMIALNANSLAYYSLLGIFFGISIWNESSTVKKIFIILLIIFDFAIGILTNSRSFVLALIILLIAYTFSRLKSPKQILSSVLVLLVLFIVTYMIVYNNPLILEGVVKRFSSDDIDGANGRVEVFVDYFNAFFSNLRFVFFGTGVLDYKNQTGIDVSFHNGFEQIIVSYGLFFGIAIIFALLYPVIKSIKETKANFVYILPLLSVILFTQTIQFLYPTMLMLPFLPAYYSIRMAEKPAKMAIK